MTMLLNFLTALAWIWGAFFGFFFISGPLVRFDNKEQVEGWFACGILGLPAWAWLIARYWI